MNVESDLKKTRYNLFKAETKDGLSDLLGGLAFLCLGAVVYSDWIIYIFAIVLISAQAPFLKKKITYPRTGYVKGDFTDKRRATKKFSILLISVLIFLSLFGVVVMLGVAIPAAISENAAMIVGVLFTVIIIAGAVLTGIKRLYAYGGIILILFIYGVSRDYNISEGKDFLRMSLGVYIMIFGSMLVVTGVVLLIRFIIKNPLEKES